MGFWSKFFGFFFRPMLYTVASDRMIAMFERGTTRAIRRLSVKEHKIHEQFLTAEKEGSMKKIIKLEHPMIKTLIAMVRKLYLFMHRQFILQYHLGLEINAALEALNRAKIVEGIRNLNNLKQQLIVLLDEEIMKIDREMKEGGVFLGGIKKISEGGDFNELIGLSRVEGRDAAKSMKLVKHIRAVAASATEKDVKRLKNDISALENFVRDELKTMKVLFYDDLTLIGYTDRDRTEMVEFFRKLEKEGFPPTLVADFLNEIHDKELVCEKRQLAGLETEARKAESEIIHGKTI